MLLLPLYAGNNAGAELTGKQSDKGASPELTAAAVQERSQKTSLRIAAAEREANQPADALPEATQAALHEKVLRLKLLNNIYALTLNALNKKEALVREQESLQQRDNATLDLTPAQNQPYPLSIYDDLLNRANEATQVRESAELGIRQTKQNLEYARGELDKQQSALRLLKEQLEQTREDEKLSRTQQEISRAEIEVEFGRAFIDLRKLSIENLQYEQSNADITLSAANRLLEKVRKNLRFDQQDLKNITDAIDKNLQRLQEKTEYILHEQSSIREALARAQKEEDGTAPDRSAEQTAARLTDLRTWDETWSKSLEFTDAMLTILNRQQQIWQWRFELFNRAVPYETVHEWQEKAERIRTFLEHFLDSHQAFHTGLLSRIAAKEMALAENPAPQLKKTLQNQLQALQKLNTYSLEYLTCLTSSKPLLLRLFNDLAAETQQTSARVQGEVFAERMQAFWFFELWVIDDKPVTVKKVVTALLILFFGILAAKYLISILSRSLLPRAHLLPGAVAAINKILFYLAILFITLLALRLVNIPLTVFTFLGGAVAIGFGFGAQNLINNFISGLVIMAERPIKVDDMIEVDGHFAHVEEIGTRCTRIRTGENVHILVPNSSFLEKNIINWTLSDNLVRASVAVGVAYGSTVREVERLLLKAAAEHSKIHKNPRPFVLFNDFGDNALMFELFFWVSIHSMIESRVIASDIRFHIEELFRQAHIVFAFPQRDVHLDARQPLEVKIINASAQVNRK